MWVWVWIKAFFHTWYFTVAGIMGILYSIYSGIPAMFRTWDFLIERFRDEPVLDILREQNFMAKELRPPSFARRTSLSVGELAKKLNRTHQSIGKSIKRLKRKDLIELYNGGIRLKD